MTLEQWNVLLDKDPEDWEARSFFAIWLKDEYDNPALAMMQDWLVIEKKRPRFQITPCFFETCWDWWLETRCLRDKAEIPRKFFENLANGKSFCSSNAWREYPDRWSAEVDLAVNFI